MRISKVSSASLKIPCLLTLALVDQGCSPRDANRQGPGAAVEARVVRQNPDSSGLAEFRVRYRGPGGRRNHYSVTVSLVDSAGHHELDPTRAWSIHEDNGSTFRVRETIEGLLPPGTHRLAITVLGQAGRIASDTVWFSLPPISFHRRIETGIKPGYGHGVGIVICPDDHRAYVTIGKAIAVVDADSLQLIAVRPLGGRQVIYGSPTASPAIHCSM